jgi:hypothetical protein
MSMFDPNSTGRLHRSIRRQFSRVLAADHGITDAKQIRELGERLEFAANAYRHGWRRCSTPEP